MLLEAKIKLMKDTYFKNPCPKIHQELLLLRAQYKDISDSKAAANLLKLQQSIFESRRKQARL